MFEKVSNSVTHEIGQKEKKQRFEGIPREVAPKRIEISIPDSEKSAIWKPGIINSNNGLTAAHDKNRPVIHIVDSQNAIHLKNEGYEAGDAIVPLTGGDQRGWHKGSKSRELAELKVNAAARHNGVKGREVKQMVNGHEYNQIVMNPFDDGDFLDMTNIAEISPTGEEEVLRDIVTLSANGEISRNLDELIGKMTSNNGILAWITPDGKVQIAPYSNDRLNRLKELGYESGHIYVPHSNGERFKHQKDEQMFAEILFADMQRNGDKMTMEERSSKFGRVLVPDAYMDIIKH